MNQKQFFYFAGKCITLDDRPETREAIQSHIIYRKIIPERFIWHSAKYHILLSVNHKFKISILSGDMSWPAKVARAGVGQRKEGLLWLDFSASSLYQDKDEDPSGWSKMEIPILRDKTIIPVNFNRGIYKLIH